MVCSLDYSYACVRWNQQTTVRIDSLSIKLLSIKLATFTGSGRNSKYYRNTVAIDRSLHVPKSSFLLLKHLI
ncbi:hypothetical protein CY34DRAFT_753204 [Suillus luteus UH-Slu-Lm8-n1]|uniref:Uncharacterized protein n=1 Tax=Suillus luteus UH-Slu-Lm8-n1 TaxID=930992 RepID=A0A0D0BI08_9AGAM|nr:hypothetical protein CY34DRAFT_753204 [Suillus luteus UH-Slu-Lm8-n1]